MPDGDMSPACPGTPTGLSGTLSKKGQTNEHLDNFIRCAADSVDWWLHCVPRGRRTDPLVAPIRGDLFDPAFRDGETGSLTN